MKDLPQDILQMLRLNNKDKNEKLNVKDGRKCKNKNNKDNEKLNVKDGRKCKKKKEKM